MNNNEDAKDGILISFLYVCNSKSNEMQEEDKMHVDNSLICEDANCDSELFFDKSDFEHFDWGTFLPHWHQDGKYVFVTFRLYDSLPQEKLQWLRDERESWLKLHPQPWDKKTTKEYTSKFGKAVDKWLDNDHGNCLLKKQSNRKIVEDALLFFDGKRYDLIAFVVMPNHVHILMKLKEGYELIEIMRSIKSFTAKKINENENKTGPVWQSESYDRLIRDQKHFENVIRYIIAIIRIWLGLLMTLSTTASRSRKSETLFARGGVFFICETQMLTMSQSARTQIATM